MKKNIFKALKFLLFLGIGIFFIWLFVRNLTPEQKRDIYHSFVKADFTWFYISMVVGIASHFLRAMRWKMLLKAMGYNPSNKNITMAVFIGYLANLALPRLGEVSRCGTLTRYEKIPFQKGFGTVITERALDMVTFLLLFFITVIIHFARIKEYLDERVLDPLDEKLATLQHANYFIYIIIGVLVATAIYLYSIRNKFEHFYLYIKFRETVKGLFEGIKSLLKIERPLLFILYTLLIWGSYWMMTHVVFMSMDVTENLSLNASLVVLMFGSIGIILVQGGIGLYPAIVAETLVLYNIPEVNGYALGWLLWSAQQVIIILLGSMSFGLLPILNKFNKDEQLKYHTIKDS
ncbi:MAG: flippase-like domain-containing protein [Bacteroidales bacterium]|nr:flippase-like domain-containing protein [Bacteroidales bacterium]MCF8334263.1 flippase-like domain-containing protein [Bacteroidales bacterium]